MTVAVLGEALIDFIEGDDGAFRPYLGGSPYNVAIGLARQGVDVSYLSPFSGDTFGDRLRNALESEGVTVPITKRSRWPTSLALVTTRVEGSPVYRLYREGIADKDTSFEEIQAALPSDIQVFHTGSLAITPSQLPKIRRLLELMRKREVVVSVDINIRLGASIETEKYLDGVKSLLGEVDIVKASDEDLAELGIDDDPRKSAEIIFSGMNGGMLLLTEGGGGALLHTQQGTIERSAYNVDEVGDTVGAGDTFHSAFLAFLYRCAVIKKPLAEIDIEILGDALEFACAAAAINVSRVGCSPPTRTEVNTLINSTPSCST